MYTQLMKPFHYSYKTKDDRGKWPLHWKLTVLNFVAAAGVVCRCKLSHFQLLLQNRLMDFDETWYAWSTHGPLQVLLFLGQIRPGVDPGRGKNRSRGSPSSRNFFFRLEGYSDKPNT